MRTAIEAILVAVATAIASGIGGAGIGSFRVFAGTQAAFDRTLAHCHPAALAWDRVHPTQTGHMILAHAFLNAIGFRWSP